MMMCSDFCCWFKLECIVFDCDCFLCFFNIWVIWDRMKKSVMVLFFLSFVFFKDFCCVFEMKLVVEFLCDWNSSLRIINVFLKDVDKIFVVLKIYICLEVENILDNVVKINDVFY